jgi:hypothetical protein
MIHAPLRSLKPTSCDNGKALRPSHHLDAGSDRDHLTAFSIVIRETYVVSTAFDPAVTSYADVDRLLRTEPQVQLTPFVLNNHSVARLCPAPQRLPLTCAMQ